MTTERERRTSCANLIFGHIHSNSILFIIIFRNHRVIIPNWHSPQALSLSLPLWSVTCVTLSQTLSLDGIASCSRHNEWTTYTLDTIAHENSQCLVLLTQMVGLFHEHVTVSLPCHGPHFNHFLNMYRFSSSVHTVLSGSPVLMNHYSQDFINRPSIMMVPFAKFSKIFAGFFLCPRYFCGQ